jgi:predicted type IV restriction endonuclease
MKTAEQILNECHDIRIFEANEAATRLKVVDHVLRDILGWSDADIHPEEHVSEDGKHTYADYVLRTANIGVVVETKKIGAAFEINNTPRKIRLTASFVQGLVGDAIIQARDYCRGLGVDFAVVTNGDAWVIFPAQRHDSVRFQDSTAIVFSNLESALRTDSQEFRELLTT